MRGLYILLLVFIASVLIEIVNATPCKDCGSSAGCRNGQCYCKSPLKGNPLFVCNHPRRYHICQIFSDPMLETVDSLNSSVLIPATFNLINTAAKLRKGKCNVKIVGYSAQKDGKYFVEGIQVTVKHVWKNKVIICIVRVIAKYEDGKYKYIILLENGNSWIKSEITTNRRYARITIWKQCQFRFILFKNKFLFVYITCCKIRFGIRPYNPDAKTTIPGVFVQVRKHKTVTIGEGIPKYICSNLTSNVDFDDLVKEYDFRSKNQLITLFTLERGEILKYPGAYPDLQGLQAKLLSCTKYRLKNLIRKAEFFHHYAKLITCVTEHEHILGLYHNATIGYCDLDTQACETSMDKIKKYCSNYVLTKNKQLKAFLRDGCV